jgi:DNA-binding NtrC family response regulator
VTRILVIDTDPGERLILRSRLSDQGYEVILADTGAKGLVEARSEAFDLVLLSAELSEGVESAEVCRRLKAIPRRVALPVVVYSDQATTHETCERIYDAGCDTFVGKSQMASLDKVLRVTLVIKGRLEELARENRNLEQEIKGLQETRAREQENGSRNEGPNTLLIRELAASRPDGLIVVDTQGTVVHVDRGACELFGTRIEGKSLGQIAPGSGLEAFVRDARTQPREQFRFDVRLAKGRADRSLMASVIPVASGDAGEPGVMRIVLLLDIGKRRVAEDVLRQRDPGIPRHQLSSLLEAARVTYGPQAILGACPESQQLRRRVIESLRRDDPVLIRGERGTGKSFLANVLHYSGRATGGLWTLRCSALAAENLDHELFGYVEGAIPGALTERIGLCLQAASGTLHLAEIADLPLEAQEALLAVLETGVVHRKGSTRPEKAQFRLIASTERDLGELSRSGRFSAGLYAKLSVCTIDVPPLRTVIADLPVFADHFLRRHAGKPAAAAIDEQALWLMQQYDWPGNLAELEDCIEEGSRRAKDEPIGIEYLTRPLRELEASALGPEITPQPRPAAARPALAASGNGHSSVDAGKHSRPWDITDEDPVSLDLYEKKALLRALESCHGDKLAAARLLKVGKSTLYRKLKRLGIT